MMCDILFFTECDVNIHENIELIAFRQDVMNAEENL